MKWLNPMVWFRRLRRGIDRMTLFPLVRQITKGDDHWYARCIHLHINTDPAWRVQNWEYTKADWKIINGVYDRKEYQTTLEACWESGTIKEPQERALK